ncbi:MAG: hypothetical protein AB1644_02565 [Candidatus Zixiibacteriota bacterium]
MQIPERIGRLILLITLVLWIVPLLLFPERLGTQVMRVSVWFVGLELLYYACVVLVSQRGMTAMSRFQAVLGSFVYRLALGIVFGLLVTVMFDMGWRAALTLGTFGYLPAVLLHIAAAPFALRPLFNEVTGQKEPRRAQVRPSLQRENLPAGMTSIAISKERGITSESLPIPPLEYDNRRHGGSASEQHPSGNQPELNGFDRATRYIGEHGSVFMAVVVDYEGLPLSSFKRGTLNPDDWAPLSLLFLDANRRVLDRTRLGAPDRLDLTLKDKRLMVARDQQYSLLVLAERLSDDTLSIRVSQAMEMIRRYMTERFAAKQDINAEKIHVSSAE